MSAISESSGLEVVMLPGLAIYSLSVALLREARPVAVPGSFFSHHPPLPSSQCVQTDRELVYRRVLFTSSLHWAARYELAEILSLQCTAFIHFYHRNILSVTRQTVLPSCPQSTNTRPDSLHWNTL